jgi:hypothetical protein
MAIPLVCFLCFALCRQSWLIKRSISMVKVKLSMRAEQKFWQQYGVKSCGFADNALGTSRNSSEDEPSRFLGQESFTATGL